METRPKTRAALTSFKTLALVLGAGAGNASAGTPQVVSDSNQFAVMEADSSAASRLEAQYPNRLRRVQEPPTGVRLNNVAVVLSKAIASAAYPKTRPSPEPLSPPQSVGACSDRKPESPDATVIQVCLTDAKEINERDRRALRGFVEFASRESLPLDVHVAGEGEWSALQKALEMDGVTPPRVRFREIRYGDGLAAGAITIHRLQK